MSEYIQASPIDHSLEYFNLGTFTRRVTTQSEAAQTWFTRGFIWSYSFNHEEAERCFEQAAVHDPNCAMAYWGYAFAAGPNYNKTWAAFDANDLQRSVPKCHRLAQLALQHLTTNPDLTPAERALITALPHRYPSPNVPKEFDSANKAYADAMRTVYNQFPEDLDVRTLFADSLMNWKPRKLYHEQTGLPIETSPVHEVRRVLEEGLATPEGKHHPGLLHMYIHLMERSATPQAALLAADHLQALVPDAGHIWHMPSHIYVLVGDYRHALHNNLQATRADDRFFSLRGGENFYSFYRLHDYHSLIYAAMLLGQSRAALEACDCMERTITEPMLRTESPRMADWLEFFCAVRVHVYIRFGMWEALKQLAVPEDQDLYCVTTTMVYYGKGIACAATGEIPAAERYRELYAQAAEKVPPTRLDFPNRIVDVLKVATAMLDGELEYRKGDYELAFRHLRRAVEMDDALLYTEPWGWMVPTRHAFAALSLEQGRVEDAARVYAEDLGLEGSLTRAHQHPNNVWALQGYHECLVKMGRQAEAGIVAQQLKVAVAAADVPIVSSCFCRRGDVGDGAAGHAQY
ncbi:hypothetical protein ASPACDRAFT_44294 [Aspergillus aculeatus ATCC 16872]|uniref:MalT-like TPR region domain-containing protein n=1 Tax=Aspergillus aculeatus (strain ATCC 16872 / CBS 172.66 / WB 5094) TaxID=690307 RepID=A0A1L9WR93_ASPA1|nr:uncharacterized protein ASPACDRAFT_44294 [Aspergillus aculeatus ATCC 16872]OJJ98664.1 hypothetical protein ASPACDRAFT_44294 [Aspergillus aculeatus ATCC 16872]